MRLDWEAPPVAVPQQPLAPMEVRFVDRSSPVAIQLADFQLRDQLLAVAFDPFNAAKRLELGIQLSDSGDKESGDQQMQLALVLASDLPEARSYRSRLAIATCGNWHAQHERWSRAAADYVLLANLEPLISERALQAATLLLTAGDRAGHRRLCQQMLERFGRTTNPNDAERTAKSCLISADFTDERTTAARLAEFAARKGAKSGDHLWFELTAGIAEYRLGQNTTAAARLGKNHESAKGIAVLDELTCLYEAMALIKMDRTDEARLLIEAAAPAVNNRFGRKPDDFSFNWHDWLIARLALQEAQRLAAEAPAASK